MANCQTVNYFYYFCELFCEFFVTSFLKISFEHSHNKYIFGAKKIKKPLGHDHHFHYGAWINVKSGSKLVINGCTLASARLILEPGSKLVISNGGLLVTPVTAKFTAPLGVTVDISNGTIM